LSILNEFFILLLGFRQFLNAT